MNVSDVLNSPWAIRPDVLTEMATIYANHRNGDRFDARSIETALGRPLGGGAPKPYTVQDGVAMIPVEGIISKRMSLFMDICGGTSTYKLQTDLSAALNDPDISGIILVIDSPGGNVDGTQNAADAIYEARSEKPISAYVDGEMCSAAYWIGSAASEVFIGADTNVVGSIGVVTTHVDTSNAEYQRGVRITDITAGKYKRIASQHAPLTPEGRSAIQQQLDQVYETFVDAVAKNRGMDAETVLSKMADGRVFVGPQAINAGLVDGKLTLPQLIKRMKQQPVKSGAARVPQPKPTSKGTIPMAAETTYTDAQIQTARDEAHKAGFDAGVAHGRIEGATAERDRIQSIEKVSLPGHETLIQNLKFDGKTSGPEAAVAVLSAEREVRAKTLATIRTDAPKPVPESSGTLKADAAVEATVGKVAAEVDVKDIATKARKLVADAQKDGQTLSFAAAVKQLTAK
jgi:signal peptide peptidase SppA